MEFDPRLFAYTGLLFTSTVFVVAMACSDDDDPGVGQGGTRCNKECQQSNDTYITPDQYDDYFINDSDGGKDMVFAVYHGVRFGDQVCDVLKSYDTHEGVAVSTNIVCPQ